MKNLLSKLWNSSPSRWEKKLFRLVQEKEEKVHPQWYKIQEGYGKGIELFLDPNKFIGWKRMLSGEYDRFFFEAILKEIDLQNKVIWDVGAHFGYNSMIFANLVGEQGKVIAFEPCPVNTARFIKHINRNAHLSKRIELHKIALSDKSGEVGFLISEDIESSPSTGSHLVDILPPQNEELYKQLNFKEIIIKTQTAYSFIKENNFHMPDIIKIDIEGAEYNFLVGAKVMLEKKPPLILMEVHNILAMYNVQKFLFKLNYDIQILDRQNLTISRCFIMAKKIT